MIFIRIILQTIILLLKYPKRDHICSILFPSQHFAKNPIICNSVATPSKTLLFISAKNIITYINLCFPISYSICTRTFKMILAISYVECPCLKRDLTRGIILLTSFFKVSLNIYLMMSVLGQSQMSITYFLVIIFDSWCFTPWWQACRLLIAWRMSPSEMKTNASRASGLILTPSASAMLLTLARISVSFNLLNLRTIHLL